MTTFAETETPTPGLSAAFSLSLTGADSVRIGGLATGGVREHVGFSGGRLEGSQVSGEVLADHSGETWLRRSDGVTVIEATYLVRTVDGEVLRVIGTGYQTKAGEFAGVRMSVVFEVDEGGRHAWLSRRAFVAERSAGSDTLDIAMVV